MIKHIVAWDLPTGAGKSEQIKLLKILLEELPALIPEIQSYEVGVNIKVAENAKDMILISTFKDQQDLTQYAGHPEHQRVLTELRKVALNTVVVDFETV